MGNNTMLPLGLDTSETCVHTAPGPVCMGKGFSTLEVNATQRLATLEVAHLTCAHTYGPWLNWQKRNRERGGGGG